MTSRSKLMALAAEQDGYVTLDDAQSVGVPKRDLQQLAHRGKIVRESTGVYRFEEFPRTRAAGFRYAVLWTGRGLAALSHDTALSVLELSDINPPVIHVTVPKGERVRRSGGDGIVVHYDDIPAKHVGWWEGIRCVKPFFAIQQAIDTRVPVQLIQQAMAEARDRGSITVAELAALRTELDGAE